MLVSILTDNYADVKIDTSFLDDEDPDLFRYIKSVIYEFSPFKSNKLEFKAENNTDLTYKDPINLLPRRINKLINKIEKVFLFIFSFLFFIN